MGKIGFTGKCPNGDISSLSEQIVKLKEVGINSLEIPIYETDVICGKRINQQELKILKTTLLDKDFFYTVHGELSVNLMDQEFFDDHKEVLKRDIEVSGEIQATHLVTHFGQTTNTIHDDSALYRSHLKRQQDTYAELGEYAKKFNVTLAIENLFPFTLNSHAQLFPRFQASSIRPFFVFLL